MDAAAKVSKNLFHSKVLFDFLKAPSFRRVLDATTLAKLQVRVDHYKHFSHGKIESLEFQERAIAHACRKSSGLWCGELWTGAGKSIIAARVALEFLKRGKKVIFICPNRMGIGNVADGIIQKFHRTFEHYKASYKIGSLDAVTLLDDVHFFTPHAFVRMSQTADPLFRKLISEAGVLIVDEAHHFPEDPKDDQVIYGKIERLASRHFISTGKKVVTLTATHGRHDGKPVFKKERPDFQITVNEAVQAGWCPEIHGFPVYLDVRAPRATQIGSEIYLNLKKRQLLKYLRKVAGVMLEVQKANPDQQFCAFVRTIREAKKLLEIWNYEARNLGFKPVALLIGTMSMAERIEIKKAIQNQEYAGYITCDVGSESIDIPRMETIHLIRRTRSINRIVQSIGRVLRNHPEKRRALVVDYNLSERRIIRACQGLEAYAHYVNSAAKRLVSGGPLVPIGGTQNADFSGITIGEERAWIERSLVQDALPQGAVYGWLTVIRSDKAGQVLCRCKCGKEHTAVRYRLLNGKSISCGCYKKKNATIPLGTRYGKLVVTKYESPTHVHCKCDCGKVTVTRKGGLVNGTTKSCGCIRESVGRMRKGRRFGKLVVLEDLKSNQVKCVCDCGNEITTDRGALRKYKRSCGCDKTPKNATPLKIGQRFDRLEVLDDWGHKHVLCVCDCGALTASDRSSLKQGNKRSCGCLALERLNPILDLRPDAVVREGRTYSIRKGSVFGWLTVVGERSPFGVECRCRCGKVVHKQACDLLRGRKTSCGCYGRTGPIKIGQVFHRLTVVADAGPGKVKCRCECGKVVIKSRSRIRRGTNKSCGCLSLGEPLKRDSRFGKLKVLEDRGYSKVSCICDCGKKRVFKRGGLVAGQNSSCGCLRGKTLKAIKPRQSFGLWTVLKEETPKKVHCRCKCGTESIVQRKHLYSGASKSCGCLTQIPRLKKGVVFGRLSVVIDSGVGIKGRGKRKILCHCSCGKKKVVAAHALINGGITSCGCAKKTIGGLEPGRRFGLLIVIKDNGCQKVRCACDCGRTAIVSRYELVRVGRKSCGCLSTIATRLKPGSKYGEWTILSDTGCRDVTARCSCGFVKKHHLRSNLTTGCSKRCSTCGSKRHRFQNRKVS